jgi:hypothetical protein
MEFSKKIILATGIIFSLVVAVCLGIFVCCTVSGVAYDWSGIVTLLGVSGGVFGTAAAFYYNKAKAENTYKLRKSFLREKYTLLSELGMLDSMRVQSEIDTEINNIESGLDSAEAEEITYQTFN